MAEAKTVPAQLSFLAIYNPSLGTTDETFEDQIVFWYSKTGRTRRKVGQDAELRRQLQDEENEKLRQIGLAQGMVDFARSFSNGQPVDSVETEKSRIVMHELEAGWWVLASVDLTRLPIAAGPPTKSAPAAPAAPGGPSVEYSSREVSPPALLLQQLIQAHGIFLLHNGSALDNLFRRLERAKFCSLLDRFWNRFAQNWDVLLHGNPAVDMLGGLKLAAGGELGIGVGEEEWGSGEREVLEDFAGRTEGLVDLVVSRFGEPSTAQLAQSNRDISYKAKQQHDNQQAHTESPWMGATHNAEAVDGIFFSGVGALTRASLRDISHWNEWIYAYGDHAYGVKDNPGSERRKRRRRPPAASHSEEVTKPKVRMSPNPEPTTKLITPPGIPPPIVSAVERSLERATSANDLKLAKPLPKHADKHSPADSGVWMKYLTLGYGSSWGGPTGGTHAALKREASSNTKMEDGQEQSTTPLDQRRMQYLDPDPDIDPEAEFEARLKTQIQLEEGGHFLIGLKGDLEDDGDELSDAETEEADALQQRILLRTLYVELKEKSLEEGDEGISELLTPISPSPRYEKHISRLRVVVYVHRPFIYTFLFHPRTDALQLPAFYRTLHTFFAPLHKPLSASTSPARVAARIEAASTPYTTSPLAQTPSTSSAEPAVQPIFDIVYDPRSLSVHASIPNIPMPGTHAAEGFGNVPIGWSRAEALNVHSAILEIWRGTRGFEGGVRELERSVKTARGWWVVWMRLDDELADSSQRKAGDNDDTSLKPTIRSGSGATERGDGYFDRPQSQAQSMILVDDGREAILVRRARDAIPENKGKGRVTSGLWGFGGSTIASRAKDAGSGWGPARLAEGVGVDARRYVEGLLSLNR